MGSHPLQKTLVVIFEGRYTFIVESLHFLSSEFKLASVSS